MTVLFFISLGLAVIMLIAVVLGILYAVEANVFFPCWVGLILATISAITFGVICEQANPKLTKHCYISDVSVNDLGEQGYVAIVAENRVVVNRDHVFINRYDATNCHVKAVIEYNHFKDPVNITLTIEGKD